MDIFHACQVVPVQTAGTKLMRKVALDPISALPSQELFQTWGRALWPSCRPAVRIHFSGFLFVFAEFGHFDGMNSWAVMLASTRTAYGKGGFVLRRLDDSDYRLAGNRRQHTARPWPVTKIACVEKTISARVLSPSA